MFFLHVLNCPFVFFYSLLSFFKTTTLNFFWVSCSFPFLWAWLLENSFGSIPRPWFFHVPWSPVLLSLYVKTESYPLFLTDWLLGWGGRARITSVIPVRFWGFLRTFLWICLLHTSCSPLGAPLRFHAFYLFYKARPGADILPFSFLSVV